jgi:hypothetical protein
MATTVLDSSYTNARLSIETAWLKGLTFKISASEAAKSYTQSDVAEIVAIDEETYRSGGKAVLGAIVGGVLTGGIGLLAGAAFGGRRKSEGSYIVKFRDGNYIAFSETNSKLAKLIKAIEISHRAKAMGSGMKSS